MKSITFALIILCSGIAQAMTTAEFMRNRINNEISRLYHTRSYKPHKDIWKGKPYKLIKLNPVFKDSDKDGYVYLDKSQRQKYKLYFKNGRIQDSSGRDLDTKGLREGGVMFVMDRFGNIFASKRYRANSFEVHSLVAGEPVVCTGRLIVHNGRLKRIDDFSGQYKSKNHYALTKVVTKFRDVGVWNNQVKVMYNVDSD